MEINMDRTKSRRWRGREAVVVMVLLVWPAVGAAQLLGSTPLPPTGITQTTPRLTGQAAAVRATTLAGSATLADSGTLGGAGDARNASLLSGSVPALLAAEVLHATTIGWSDQVASDAALANLAMDVAGVGISAEFVMATAQAVLGAAGSGASLVENLSINGAPVSVDGSPNQVLAIPGGRLVINEQRSSPGGMVVNALHVTVDGVADVVIGSANAAVQ
jgi:hypothetical protein